MTEIYTIQFLSVYQNLQQHKKQYGLHEISMSDSNPLYDDLATPFI